MLYFVIPQNCGQLLHLETQLTPSCRYMPLNSNEFIFHFELDEVTLRSVVSFPISSKTCLHTVPEINFINGEPQSSGDSSNGRFTKV
jgi:hypothetical protein